MTATVDKLPDDPVSSRAIALLAGHAHPAIVNHSVRTYLHALRVARSRDITDFPRDLVFLSCILHDIGTAPAYDGTHRFEVDGADGAAAFLTAQELPADQVDQVWLAIALHTTPHIAERRGPVAMLTRLGVLADFGAAPEADRAAVEPGYPRLEIERVLVDAVVGQALRDPGKAPDVSWPGYLLRAHRDGRHDAF